LAFACVWLPLCPYNQWQQCQVSLWCVLALPTAKTHQRENSLKTGSPFFFAYFAYFIARCVCDVGLQVGDGDIRGVWRVSACLRDWMIVCVKKLGVLKKVSSTSFRYDKVDVLNMA
jgi:hypothetical protein